jgi:CRP-like cAMP-binding protein
MLESQTAIGRTRMTLVASAVEERAGILKMTHHLAFPGVRDFSDRELRALADQMELYQAAAGAVVFEEGSREAWMGIVAGGHVEIGKEDRSGSDCLLATLGVGKVLGEMALVDAVARSARAVALTDARILVLTKQEFERLLVTSPSLGVKLLLALARLMSRRLRLTSGRLVESLSS